jgi:hypothetical protein
MSADFSALGTIALCIGKGERDRRHYWIIAVIPEIGDSDVSIDESSPFSFKPMSVLAV